ncbi:MAG: histone deacetylase family protein [Casimicrobiaceae bacterium]|nr:histone deacetylase family protein [Casimicrobiaceae bacterium]MCX8098165.1 histone deacetylase family protein [Casimicrobiaceae bacterium]MDW8312787.1 histone deacetylase family protein [Burkholderiales bacterium]
MSSVAYLTHPYATRHAMGAHHPERPERVQVIERALAQSGCLARMDCETVETLPAGWREAVTRAHRPAYLEALESLAPSAGLVPIDADTAMNPFTWPAAQYAAATALRAVDRVLGGQNRRAFCNVRPPGHHAERARAMGFCLLNNAAIAVLHALEAHGLERVALIDFDVHHGNGSEEILVEAMNAGRVLMVSTFQHPLYPGSGVKPLAMRGSLNIPLAAGSDGRTLREVVETRWLPALDAFAPQLFVVSAGFDAHRADPLAGLAWTEQDYDWLTRTLVEVAERHAQGRMVSMLEGGYNLEALAASARAHVEALLDPA